MNQNGSGFLRIRVTEASGTLPIQGAVVRIMEYPEEVGPGNEGGRLLYSLRSDADGLTPTAELPAPPADESMVPGASQPYAVYNISVTYAGYYPVEGVGVPVFDRVTAIQPVNLLPYTENDRIAGTDSGRVMIYEFPDTESLQPGGVTREDIGSSNGTVSGGVYSGGDR